MMVLRTHGSGQIPDHVRENHDEATELQRRRLVFANFIAAVVFGRLSGLRHMALSGAQHAGMHKIVVFAPTEDGLRVEHSRIANEVLAPKLRVAREQPSRIRVATPEQLSDIVTFVEHIGHREEEFEEASLQACMVMNYQAAILHNEQHSAASLALNFAVAEALTNELFLAYGIAGGRSPKAFANRAHTVGTMTDAQLSRWRMAEKIKRLADGGLIDWYLRQRLDEARILRNELMHSAAAVTATQSGTMQTVVRDLWGYFVDQPFELVAGWSMRI
jgi:hypothetical protein